MRFKRTLIISLILILFLFTVGAINAQDINETSDDSQKSYTDLANEIDSALGPVIEISGNYKYNSSLDNSLIDGVKISRSVSIVGRGNASIDGSNLARVLNIGDNCTVILENITVENGYSTDDGAGLILGKDSHLMVHNCTFKNNKVYNSNGGAIYAERNVNVDILDCVFENNTSIRESDLEWKEYKKGMGSAICVGVNSNLTLYKTVFKENNAYLATVLLVSYSSVNDTNMSVLYVKDCLFENNTSFSSGVIYLDELGAGEIYDTVFRNNTVTNTGSPIILDASCYAIVKNCLFEENSGIKGGAIHIKVYDYDCRSNVSIINCNFTKNWASVYGGAISSKYALANILNCSFTENTAETYGGAIFTKLSEFNITDSSFYGNSAQYGGAVFIKEDNNNTLFDNSVFVNNSASVKGGAIYSKIREISSINCTYINNTAPKGGDVYGLFTGQITQTSPYYGDVSLSIDLNSIWKMPSSQMIKLTFAGNDTYTTGWLQTDDEGKLDYRVPFDMNLGNYTVTVSMKSGIFDANQTNISVVRVPYKIKVDSLVTTFESDKSLKMRVVNNVTNRPVQGADLTIRVYTGSMFEEYNITCDDNGYYRLNTSNLSVGKHKVRISAQNNNTIFDTVKTKITVKKAEAKVVYPKKIKKPEKLRITLLNKVSKKAIKKQKFTVRVYTGKSYKEYNLKTNSKGILKIKTKKLALGNHKIAVILKDDNYKIKEKFYVKMI